jgi:hypothetical protein
MQPVFIKDDGTLRICIADQLLRLVKKLRNPNFVRIGKSNPFHHAISEIRPIGLL